MGFEPTASSLGSWHSTTKLRPPTVNFNGKIKLYAIKMWQVELCVQLKTYDLSALTAKQTLWEMGYKKLTDIFRQDYYLFNIPKETKEEAESIVKSLAEKTPLFVNPNKHIYYIRSQESGERGKGTETQRHRDTEEDRSQESGYKIQDAGVRIQNSKFKIQNSKFEEVLVWYREDVRRKMLLDSLKSFGYNVEDILCGVLWQIEIGDRDIGQEIVERLLVNPHSQGYKIL